MTNYIVKTFGKSIIKISEEDFRNIGGKSSGMVYTRDGRSFNLSSVDSIIPESDYALEKANDNNGVLYDGQKVVKKFGVWYINDGTFQLVVDPAYHPEVAHNKVLSPMEYENYLALPEEEKIKMLPVVDKS